MNAEFESESDSPSGEQKKFRHSQTLLLVSLFQTDGSDFHEGGPKLFQKGLECKLTAAEEGFLLWAAKIWGCPKSGSLLPPRVALS